jgi:hypothetical protein
MVVCNRVYTVQNLPNDCFQMIGVSSKFSFDVTSHNPPWMDEAEDEQTDVRRRPRTPVQVSEPPPAPLMDIRQVITDMGFLERFGEALCRTVLDRYPNDLERIVHELTLYAARTDQLNRLHDNQ